jgi:hypothetical protein
VQVAATIEHARYAVVGQLISAAPPTSVTMLGSMVATSSTFIECSSTPPSSTAREGIHSGVNNATQPECRRYRSTLDRSAFLKVNLAKGSLGRRA